MSLDLRGGGGQHRSMMFQQQQQQQFSVFGFLTNLVCGIVFIVAVVVLVTLYLQGDLNFNNDNGDFVPENVTIELISEDNITRTGNDYVALIFVSDMEPAVSNAFTTAASRWSAIVAGTSLVSANFVAGKVLCDAVEVAETMSLNFLTIVARVRTIDGASGILGQARPCNVVATGFLNGFLPVFGLMDFDSADVNQMVSQGIITAVITHEMGHVLGIGTLWQGSVQGRFTQQNGDTLLENPILNDDGSLAQSAVQPKFIGTNAISAFVSAGGSASQNGVPVENGVTNGQQLFNPLTKGAGSIDSHWDEDFMGGELMEFRISASSNSHPLSAVSIKSLQDVGYTVSTAGADSFSVGSFTAARLRGGSNFIYFTNDVPEGYLDMIEVMTE